MVEFIEETERGSSDGEGEFYSIAPAEFTGLTLEERWSAVKTFIQSGTQPDQEVEAPEVDIPSQPDVDLSDLGNQELLRVIAETVQVQSNTQISMLSTLFDIFASVRGTRNITIIGAEITDQADVAEEVISEESPQDSVLTRKLFVRASNGNTSPIAFGDDQINPQSAFVLNKGEAIELDVDIGRLNLYMASEESGQEVQLLGFR